MVLGHSNTGMVGSNPTQGVDCVCIVLYSVEQGLTIGQSPPNNSYQMLK
jgi:hypothetical protein